MNRFELISQIKKYKAFNEQEEKDKYLLLEWIIDNEDAFSRENKIAHITATGWVVNKDRSKVLMVYHNIYDSWSLKDCGRVIKGQIKYPDKSALQLRFVGIYFLSSFF